jgi:tRNA U34 5-methylaminomethyl-2-thiouridine-forming methyltransferase MnmC
MIDESFELKTLTGGIATLRCRSSGETFHPAIGPMAEAQALHIHPQRLLQRATSTQEPLVIWDVGLGAAGNAIAVIDALGPASVRASRIELHSFDRTLAPLQFALQHVDQLNYLRPHLRAIHELLAHRRTDLANLSWTLHMGDFGSVLETTSLPAPHAVLFDPYSPRTNPEIWSLKQFIRLRARMPESTPALLTSYSRSTAVRVTLLLAGFFVGCGDRVGEKDETTIAANGPDLLARPLDEKWLARVAASTASAPLRDRADFGGGRISEEEFAAIRKHPQFTRSENSRSENSFRVGGT